MIYFPKTRAQLSYEVAVASGVTVAAEGQLLVANTTLGVFGAQPTAGASGELILGFAISAQITLATFPKVESFIIGSGFTYTTARTPQASTLLVYNTTNSAVISAGASATTYALVGSVITFGQGAGTGNCAAGQAVTITYRYAPSAFEAEALQGDITPGGTAAALLGQVGVIKSGTIYTSEYDTSCNWNATNPTVYSFANGRVSTTSGGTTLNAVVVSAPNSSGPQGAFLGLEFSAL